ncbi:MAG: GntR family transcriptional regulator [Candidatus Marinimicrobia bacterium]|nr:GntR family transcriptional regulator [Candidatus Neomarinimicrobiota bacterium]
MTIEFDNDRPIYLQIADMIREAIMAGDIEEGNSIPSVREISVEHSLNPQTVLNATQVLINEGLLEKRRGLGMFVQEGARKKLLQSELNHFKEDEVPALVSRARLLGIQKPELIEIVDDTYEEEAA